MITLRADTCTATVSPEHGGIVTDLMWTDPAGREHALLYRPAGAVPTREAPNFMGLWAMLPFANRAFDCVIDDGHQRLTVPVNDPARASNIHGFGWQSVWDVAERDAASCVLVHRRENAGDAYAYQARLSVRLGDGFMRAGLSIINLADRALPFGAGFHPWFPAAADTRFAFSSGGRLAFGEAFRATGLIAHDGEDPFAQGIGVGALRTELAVSAVDWTGEAVLTTPSCGLALHIAASPNFRHPVLWAPSNADFICFEPQSHVIGAPSLAAARGITPLVQLQPGESLEGWMTIRPAAI